jgi:AraC family transcriptional regulator of adaptative response / DNA-3-methyladenine glycosylase II
VSARRNRTAAGTGARAGAAAGAGAELELELSTSEPFDPAWPLGFFARRAVAGVEEILPDGGYRRSVRLAHGAGVVELRSAGSHARGRARSRATAAIPVRLLLDDERDRADAERICRQLFDLDCDPRVVTAALGGDPVIGEFVRAAPGRRVPGTSDPHELAVRAVLGQQISVAGAATLAARLVAAYGEPLRRPAGAVTHLFPTAAALAAADPATLPMPAARRRALLGLTAALAQGEVTLRPGADSARGREALMALPGIGPWTAEYIAMRALRDPDAFMPTDLGVKHALDRLGLGSAPREAAALAERWRPYRAYALQHLWAQLAG